MAAGRGSATIRLSCPSPAIFVLSCCRLIASSGGTFHLGFELCSGTAIASLTHIENSSTVTMEWLGDAVLVAS